MTKGSNLSHPVRDAWIEIYMAMAGWKAEDMLNGIEGVMDLAAASG